MLDRQARSLEPSAVFKRSHLKDFAAQRLRDAIIRCELRPGAMISEAALAERFGLGKAPIRAALVRLEAAGLVRPVPRQGYVVAGITLSDVRHLAAIRRALEPLLAEVRLDHGEAEQIERLAGIAAAAAGSPSRAARESALNALVQYRHTLLAATGNPLLIRTLADAWDQVERIERFIETTGAEPRPPSSLEELTAALLRHDAARARVAIAAAVEAEARHHSASLLRLDVEVSAALPSPASSAEDGHKSIGKTEQRGDA